MQVGLTLPIPVLISCRDHPKDISTAKYEILINLLIPGFMPCITFSLPYVKLGYFPLASSVKVFHENVLLSAGHI